MQMVANGLKLIVSQQLFKKNKKPHGLSKKQNL
jgi:hypothetical protein